jgi:hypothetical protein
MEAFGKKCWFAYSAGSLTDYVIVPARLLITLNTYALTKPHYGCLRQQGRTSGSELESRSQLGNPPYRFLSGIDHTNQHRILAQIVRCRFKSAALTSFTQSALHI